MRAHAIDLRHLSILALVTGCPADSRDGDGADGGTEASTTAPASASQGETSDGTTTNDAEADDGEAPQPIYDVATIPDAPDFGCQGGKGNSGGAPELSYIWISNSAQGTISKIDTQTVEEEGRYSAKPFNGDPSRTTVNLNGDVAVANRNGGVAKFWANPAHCQDTNGMPGIQTSTGATDILGFGEDDCMAWYTEFTCGSQRPMAWTRGTWNEGVCGYVDAKLWTVCDSQVHLLDGETGEIEETIPIPGSSVFVYGGAADANGTFWGLNTYGSPSNILRVDGETHELTTHAGPASGGYGITVDPEGRPWLCGGGGVSRFNLDDSTWDSAGTTGGIGGCMTDGGDLIWHSNGSGTLLGYNIETLQVDEQVQLPEYVHGISVDFYGHVWGVSFAGNNAYRADPASGDVVTYSGLFGAYTYSDMTGHNLSTAGGGGVPQG
jgi:hypothetical protein